MLSVFPARSIFALRIEGSSRAIYAPSNYEGDSKLTKAAIQTALKQIKASEYGTEAIYAHLKGEAFVGVYPIMEDSAVQWFALDFDDKTAATIDPIIESAREQQQVLAEAGLPTYLEISQSGKGVHLWGFLEEPVNAGRIRHALSPLIVESDTYDRMFPNNDGIDETRPLGNLIALPLHGNRVAEGFSVFIDENNKPYENQFVFLSTLERIPLAKVTELFDEAGHYSPDKIRTGFKGESETLTDSWKITNRKYGSPFIRHCYDHATEIDEPTWYALACQFSQFVDGRELFHEWSAQDVRRYNVGTTDRKYDQAVKANKPHSCEAIRHNIWADCADDRRFYGVVWHPYDLAKVPFLALTETTDSSDETIKAGLVRADEGFANVLEELRDIQANPGRAHGYEFGIPPLDEHVGMRPGTMVVMAARSGFGKSAWVGHVINALVDQGVTSAFASLEMTSQEFWTRQLSTKTDVSQTRMKAGKLTDGDWKRLNAWVAELRDPDTYPVIVDEHSRTMERIYEFAGRVCHEAPKDRDGKPKVVLFVDYLQLVQGEGDDDRRIVSRTSKQLTELAKALGICVVALAQLNRAAENNTDTKPSLAWLRDSGQIEQDAHVVMYLMGERGPGVIERLIPILKNRHGTGGIEVRADFNQPLMQFGESGKWARDFNSGVHFDNDAPTVSPDDEDLFGDLGSISVSSEQAERGQTAEVHNAFYTHKIPKPEPMREKTYVMRSTPLGPVAVKEVEEKDKWAVPFEGINVPVKAKKAFTF